MQTIVVPTDFSPVSLNAVNYATDMARSLGASVSLLHISVIPMSFGEVPLPPNSIDDMEKEAEEALLQLKASLEHRTGGNVVINTEVKSGSVVPQIISYCETVKPALIVMATHGSSAIERLLFGSNTIGVMKRVTQPLLVVPMMARFTGIKNIGLACDMKDTIETTPFKKVKNLLKLFEAKLFVLYVSKKPEPVYSLGVMKESKLLHEMIQELNPTYRFIDNVCIEQGLSEFAKSNKLDVLIAIPKKHSFPGQVFHKSHTKQLALSTEIPLMAIHD